MSWIKEKTTWAVASAIFSGILSEGIFNDMPGVQRWLRLGVIISVALAAAFVESSVKRESRKMRGIEKGKE